MQSWTIFLEIIQIEPPTRTEWCPDIFMEYYTKNLFIYLSTILCLDGLDVEFVNEPLFVRMIPNAAAASSKLLNSKELQAT